MIVFMLLVVGGISYFYRVALPVAARLIARDFVIALAPFGVVFSSVFVG